MIPIFKPSFGEEELNALREIFASGWIGLGPKVKDFEEKFSSFIGVKHAVGLNSGTAALHLAMKVMEVEGGEVITTPMTFISTTHAIIYNDATPVFCDIEDDTLNIDAKKINDLITDKTKAIVCVHYGGHACDMDRIVNIAKRYNLKLIEDCAHGTGGEYKGKRLGSIGDIGCFSFHAVKNLATGEGGMITIDDPQIYQRLQKLRWLGITKDTWSREEKDKMYSWYYDVEEVGFKYHMNDIPATLGLVQLAKLEKTNNRRREIADRYTKSLSALEWIETPVMKDYTKSAWHNYVIKTIHRDELNEYLKEKEISTGVHYIPNNHYEMYRDCKGPTPIAEKVWKRILTLPVYPDLDDEQVDYIIDSIKQFKP